VPGWQRLEIPLGDVAGGPRDRPMDTKRIERLELFTSGLSSPAQLGVDNVRLQ
jgi:hypothetical protein